MRWKLDAEQKILSPEDKIRDDIKNRVREDIENKIRERGRSPGARSVLSGLIPGAVLILIGLVFLLDHLGVVHLQRLWNYWPMVLVLVGVAKLTQPGSRSGAVFWILIGGVVQLNQLGYLHLSWGTLWPLALITAGIFLLSTRLETFHFQRPAAVADGNEVLNENVLFGGVERRIQISNFRGGNIVATFGGVEIDFRATDIEGNEAVIYLEAIFGGIELIVPERWTVVYQGQSVFGGYSDETRPPTPDAFGGVLGSTPKKTLILRGRAIFGGITVKN